MVAGHYNAWDRRVQLQVLLRSASDAIDNKCGLNDLLHRSRALFNKDVIQAVLEAFSVVGVLGSARCREEAYLIFVTGATGIPV